jgi:TonB family protein
LTGNQEQAIRFRDEAEELAKDPDLSPYISGRTRYQACIYANLAGSLLSCSETEAPTEKIISAGWLNSRALELPQPVYPAHLSGKQRIKAQVDVRLLIGTDGNVISAEVIRGPAEFHTAAIEAAQKAKFSPMFLSGQPTKVSGWMSLVFNP